jgi:hypothetical protein
MSNQQNDARANGLIEAKKAQSHGRTKALGLDSAGAPQHPLVPPVELPRGKGTPGAAPADIQAHLGRKASHGVAPSLRDRHVLATHVAASGVPHAGGMATKVAHGIADSFETAAGQARNGSL